MFKESSSNFMRKYSGRSLTQDEAKEKLTHEERQIFNVLTQYGVIIDNIKRVNISRRLNRMMESKVEQAKQK